MTTTMTTTQCVVDCDCSMVAEAGAGLLLVLGDQWRRSVEWGREAVVVVVVQVQCSTWMDLTTLSNAISRIC